MSGCQFLGPVQHARFPDKRERPDVAKGVSQMAPRPKMDAFGSGYRDSQRLGGFRDTLTTEVDQSNGHALTFGQTGDACSEPFLSFGSLIYFKRRGSFVRRIESGEIGQRDSAVSAS